MEKNPPVNPQTSNNCIAFSVVVQFFLSFVSQQNVKVFIQPLEL